MKLISLSQGKFAKVDDEDFERLSKFKWCFADGYAVRGARQPDKKIKIFRMHREVLGLSSGGLVDHANHDSLDNQKSNLRTCTPTQNSRNKRGPYKNSKSGNRGICVTASGKYQASIRVNRIQKYLGTFESKADAIMAQAAAAEKYFGEFKGGA